MRTFNVHLFPVICKTIDGIEAESPEEAVRIAREQFLSSPQEHLEQGMSEFAEEFSHFAVDAVHANGCRDSFSYYCRDDPLMSTLARLAHWHDQQSDSADVLTHIVNEINNALDVSL